MIRGTDILNPSTATTAAQKAREARLKLREPDPRAARMYPSMSTGNAPPSKGERILGDQGDPRFQDPSRFRLATEQTKRALRRYPSLATAEHYDAKIDGKNPDGTDRVLIRNRRDVPR